MKKILALVLALVMTMSVAAISSGAAFSDADSVQYTDAVNTLNALGVLGGYADGSIRPAADVTRGAAAKMVAMVATGSNATAIGYYKGTSSFADVPATHTFADAVAFCVARGIVAGYGDGNYGVADNVKGWAVAKMALVAMGYDAAAFGMEGAGSALNTITLATQKHLFDGMKADFVATEAASREECAQIIWNAMRQVGVVKGSVNSDGSYTYTTSGATKLEANYNAIEYGVVTANAATGATYGNTEMGSVKLTNATGLDMIGHKVMYVNTGATKVNGADTAFAVVDVSTVVNVPYGYVASEKNNQATFGYKASELTGTAKKFDNYAEDSTVSFTLSDSTVTDGTYVLCDKEVVSYLTGDFEVGYVSDYKAGDAKNNGYIKVTNKPDATAVTTEYDIITKTGDTNPTLVSYYDGIAIGDIVLVQDTGLLTTLTKAATVAGNVSAVNDGTSKSITIGGKAYAQSSNFTAEAADVVASGSVFGWTAAMNNDVVAYLDAYGAVVAILPAPEAVTDAGLVFVVAKYTATSASNAYGEAGSTTYYVQGVDVTGAEVTYQVTKATYNALVLEDDPATTDVNESVAGLYKAATAIGVDTDNYNLSATYATFSAADDTNGAWKIEDGAIDATALKAKDYYYFASDVKTIYVSGALSTLKTEVKAGAQTAAAADYYAVKASGSNYDVKYIFVVGTPSTTVATTDVALVFANSVSKDAVSYTLANGTPSVAYKHVVYVNGAQTTVTVNSDTVTAGAYKVSKDSATGLDVLTSTTVNKYEGAVSNLYNGMITIGSNADKNAASAKVVDVQFAAAAADKQAVWTEISNLTALVSSDYTATVYAVYTETAGVVSIDAIYVLSVTGRA